MASLYDNNNNYYHGHNHRRYLLHSGAYRFKPLDNKRFSSQRAFVCVRKTARCDLQVVVEVFGSTDDVVVGESASLGPLGVRVRGAGSWERGK